MLLALDTCLNACSATLRFHDGEQVRAISKCEQMDRGHAERLAPIIQDVMLEAGVGFEDVEEFAITSGPGSFTGVRLGIALLRGMNISLKRPIYVTTSLHLLAASWRKSQENFSPAIVVQDARRDAVYVQAFLNEDTLSGRTPPPPAQMISIDVLNDYLFGLELKQATLIGSGAHFFTQMGEIFEIQVDLKKILPCAEILAEIAQNAQDRQQTASPLYLRPADAKPQTGKSIQRQS